MFIVYHGFPIIDPIPIRIVHTGFLFAPFVFFMKSKTYSSKTHRTVLKMLCFKIYIHWFLFDLDYQNSIIVTLKHRLTYSYTAIYDSTFTAANSSPTTQTLNPSISCDHMNKNERLQYEGIHNLHCLRSRRFM